MLNFNEPLIYSNELEYIKKALASKKISGDGEYSLLCHKWLEKKLSVNKALLTTSGTAALEMSAILINIQPGDEIIMPSFTFVSTANAFVLRGAKIVFVDIRPETMNVDEEAIERAINKKTKAIVVVHYAGVSCDMAKINKIARKNHLLVVEDAAQGIMSKFKNKYLGSIGDIGCLSFHETKNINCGEGGAILINNPKLIERAEIIREKGTNRSKFFRGEIDKYSWVDIGSSYLPSEINAAFLYAQLEKAEEITQARLRRWNLYYKLLKPLQDKDLINLPTITENCQHNGHMFFIKTKDLQERSKLISYLKQRKIMSVFHYIPLHSSPAGKKFSIFNGQDIYTTSESEKLLRLPMHLNLSKSDVEKISFEIHRFYADRLPG